MSRHLVCLTIDTDPDGLSGVTVDRESLTFDSMDHLRTLPELLHSTSSLVDYRIPITWFVRADDQIRHAFGNPLHIYERFESFFRHAVDLGHELGWHPHLYTIDPMNQDKPVISNEVDACKQLTRVWEDVRNGPHYPLCFRNGEGWHTEATLNCIEEFGIIFDSTAIPGRLGGGDHPMNWQGAANHPYYPDLRNILNSSASRPLLELPMNTWQVEAPYDDRPKLRYMAPSVHESIFKSSLSRWQFDRSLDLHVWVLICHPDELTHLLGEDLLFSRSTEALCRNLCRLVNHIETHGDTVEFVTVSKAGQCWKNALEAAK